jgi:hypothetical protein
MKRKVAYNKIKKERKDKEGKKKKILYFINGILLIY